jgi:hypothetical protein
MAQMEYEPVTLSTLGEGAAEELFSRVWDRVLENILDPNFPATEARKVTLIVTVKPNEDRTIGAVDISADAKLPTGIGASSVCHIGRQGGRALAVQSKARQLQIDWDESSKPHEIRPSQAAAETEVE